MQQVKPCPACGARIEKAGGCDLMRCHCGHRFCWLCSQPDAQHSGALCAVLQVSDHPVWGPQALHPLTKPVGAITIAGLAVVAASVAVAVLAPVVAASSLVYAARRNFKKATQPRAEDQISLARI